MLDNNVKADRYCYELALKNNAPIAHYFTTKLYIPTVKAAAYYNIANKESDKSGEVRYISRNNKYLNLAIKQCQNQSYMCSVYE